MVMKSLAKGKKGGYGQKKSYKIELKLVNSFNLKVSFYQNFLESSICK